jgi:hypothetical protein
LTFEERSRDIFFSGSEREKEGLIYGNGVALTVGSIAAASISKLDGISASVSETFRFPSLTLAAQFKPIYIASSFTD